MILQRILAFPTFIALVIGVVVGLLGGWPAAMKDVLQPLGAR